MKDMRQLLIFLSFTLLLCSGAAQATDLQKLQFPKPGERAAFSWGSGVLDALGSDHVSAATVSGLVHRLQSGDELRLRGAREATLFRKLSPAVVLIVTDESIGSGSVFFPEKNIFTNWHVVAGYETVTVVFKPASPVMKVQSTNIATARVLFVDQIADLAILDLVEPVPVWITPIHLGNTADVSVGDDVHLDRPSRRAASEYPDPENVSRAPTSTERF